MKVRMYLQKFKVYPNHVNRFEITFNHLGYVINEYCILCFTNCFFSEGNGTFNFLLNIIVIDYFHHLTRLNNIIYHLYIVKIDPILISNCRTHSVNILLLWSINAWRFPHCRNKSKIINLCSSLLYPFQTLECVSMGFVLYTDACLFFYQI